MRNTIRLKMTYDEVRVMVFALNELRNSLIAENRSTDAVDDILLELYMPYSNGSAAILLSRIRRKGYLYGKQR